MVNAQRWPYFVFIAFCNLFLFIISYGLAVNMRHIRFDINKTDAVMLAFNPFSFKRDGLWWHWSVHYDFTFEDAVDGIHIHNTITLNRLVPYYGWLHLIHRESPINRIVDHMFALSRGKEILPTARHTLTRESWNVLPNKFGSRTRTDVTLTFLSSTYLEFVSVLIHAYVSMERNVSLIYILIRTVYTLWPDFKRQNISSDIQSSYGELCSYFFASQHL